MINKNNLLYAYKSYTLGDYFYWRVIGRFRGDKKEVVLARCETEESANKFMREEIK